MKIKDFQGTAPRMALEDFFAGQTRAWGLFQDRFGTVRRQFSVEITGLWDERAQELELTETFDYDDGGHETRVWTINKLGDTHYRATTPNVVGAADIRSHGNAANLKYRMRIPIGTKVWALDFDDWMFRQDDEVMINRADVTKWGLQLGTATIFFRKDSLAQSNPTDTAALGIPRTRRTNDRAVAEGGSGSR